RVSKLPPEVTSLNAKAYPFVPVMFNLYTCSFPDTNDILSESDLFRPGSPGRAGSPFSRMKRGKNEYQHALFIPHVSPVLLSPGLTSVQS
ncbi:hypothetical protein J6590_095390, partial [Homalodisca vitripennis]